jgi:MYXO-CTERM domain-containing protein
MLRGGGCRCATPGGPAPLWVALLGIAALVRRRR